jgi:hypothetical protein
MEMLGDQVDEAAHLCREVLTMRINRIDRPLDGGELVRIGTSRPDFNSSETKNVGT